MFELYIYYQVSDVHAPELLPLIRQLQAAMTRDCGVVTGLKRRPGSEQGLQTWMEIYQRATPGFGDTLALAVAAADIGRLVAGSRHTEVFTEMPPCA